jgi:hypothetical protein
MMPQADDELRKRWGGEDGVGDDKAINHLRAKGFTFTRGGMIEPPPGWSWAADKDDTWGAVCFLCDEWDYGYEPGGIHG